MSAADHPQRAIVSAASVPRLARHNKLRHDSARGSWVILAPERVFTPDPIAVAVLQLCDGERNVAAIAANLAETYNAPADRIAADVIAMLQDLADKGVITA